MAKTAELKVRIEELEEELRRSKAREKELKAELIEARDLLGRQADTVESVHDLHQGWIDALQMVQSEDGTWSMSLAFKDQIEAHSKLVVRWNRLVDRWNREVAPQPVGRPLQASDAQVKKVKKLRKKGRSLRGIVMDTGLSMSTVRTITSRDTEAAQKEKAKRKRELGRLRAAEYRGRVRQLNILAKRTPAVLDDLKELTKAAKGLAES